VSSFLVELALVLLAVTATAGRPPAAPTDGAARKIVVSGQQWARGVTVSRHDMLIVQPPAHYEEWRVHAAPADVVRLQTTGDRVRRPGTDGWQFEAATRGTAVITFTPFVPSGENSSVPNEPHFTLRVTVQ
jgi:hypothetical protein